MPAGRRPSDASVARFEELLGAVRARDRAALDRLFEMAYSELRSLARSVSRSFPEDSLEVTGLVSETYLKLVRAKRLSIEDRVHFFALAARAMRQILIGRAQQKGRQKRGGGERTLEVDDTTPDPGGPLSAEDLIALDEGLARLAEHDPRQVQIVELRFLEGLSEEEVASLFGLSTRTVRREWARARTFLEHEMSGGA